MYNNSFSTIDLHAVGTAKSLMDCFRVNSTELASLALPNITCGGYTRSTMSIKVNPHLKHSPHAIQDMHDFLLLNMYKHFKNNFSALWVYASKWCPEMSSDDIRPSKLDFITILKLSIPFKKH